MATYTQCPKCYKLTLREENNCDTCGHELHIQIEPQPGIVFFPTGYWEHLASEPIKIKSRQQLKDVCAEHGVRANILD